MFCHSSALQTPQVSCQRRDVLGFQDIVLLLFHQACGVLLLFGCDMSQQLSRTRVAPANSVFVCLVSASQKCVYGLMVCCS